MLSKKVQAALNAHLNKELYSEYLYLAMAAYFDSTRFEGFARWMRAQASEEREHAEKFWTYIDDREGRVVLEAIARPPADYKGPLDVFQQAYDHEREVTKAIHELYALARADNDYATEVFLNWFIAEQVEEEKMTSQIVEKLRALGDSKASLLILDRELGSRSGG